MEEPNLSGAGEERAVRSPVTLIVVGLIAFAVFAIGVRMWLQGEAKFPTGDQIWSVTLNLDLLSAGSGASIRLPPPWDTRNARLYAQELLHPGMRHRRTRADQTNRDTVLVAVRSGRLVVEARYDIHISRIARPEPSQNKLKESNRAAWLVASDGVPVESHLAASVIGSLKHDKPDAATLVRRIFDHVSERVVVRSTASDDGGITLQQHRGTRLGANRALLTLLRAAHLPARPVVGLELALADNPKPIHWAEVYYDERWHALDVVSGHAAILPPEFVPLRKGSELLLQTEKLLVRTVRWLVRPSEPPRGLLVSESPRPADILDLTRLPADSQETLALILLLPFGALTTVFLRQVVGIRTFGTFSATLLALAAVFVDWLTGVITFALITVVGIAGRALMPALELSRIPRLSIVFTSVAFIMVMVVSMLSHFDWTVESGIVLLPIVILTTLVDSIYAVADERGPHIALFRLGWTLFTALIVFGILSQSRWGMWILTYPEVHAATIAAIILAGHYQGRQLASLKPFAWIKEPPSGKGRTAAAGKPV